MISRKIHIVLVPAILIALILACSSGERGISDQTSAPVAKIVPKTDTLHGDVRVDNYFWLRERSNPEVIEYLEAENEYTKQAMKRISNTGYTAGRRAVSKHPKRFCLT